MPENLFVDPSAIERRAYELYCARGCADGHDLDDWLAAEKELLAETDPVAQPAAAPAREAEAAAPPAAADTGSSKL
jgi:hypothetical protein